MASWDVFHAESLELERDLSSEAVRAALAAGSLNGDDLVRPAGTSAPWARLADLPELTAGPEPPPVAPPPPEIFNLEPTPAPEPAPPSRRPTPPPRRESAEPPARIRPGRIEPPPVPPEASDFEFRVEPSSPEMPAISAPASAIAPPAWIELGGGSDDVTFPVLDEPEPTRPAPQASSASWEWPDDDEEEDEDQDNLEENEPDNEIEILDDDECSREILDVDGLNVPSPHSSESARRNGSSSVSLPVVPSRDWNEDRPPIETHGGDDEDFSLSRGGPTTVEELDLAPMVDVAFQLVLFFMVTATTILYKTLEIPKPSQEQKQEAMTQGNNARPMEDLKKVYVMVEIDAAGTIKIDGEPVAANVDAIAERLRTAREKSGRTIMLLSADYATPHRNAVLAYDASIEIGMGIAIARPKPPQGPAPSVFPGASGGGKPAPPAATTNPPAPAPSPAGGTPF